MNRKNKRNQNPNKSELPWLPNPWRIQILGNLAGLEAQFGSIITTHQIKSKENNEKLKFDALILRSWDKDRFLEDLDQTTIRTNFCIRKPRETHSKK